MPISISDTIDIQYRLQPQDLGGRARRVLVRSVTLQGVEAMTPLLHFEGMARPLALDAVQRVQIAAIARSALLVDWIGLPLVLRPVRTGGFETIALARGNDLRAAHHALPLASWLQQGPAARSGRTLLRMALLLILLLALAAAVSALDMAPLLSSLQAIFSR